MAGLPEKEAVQLEGARVEVQNGTLSAGLARRTADYLDAFGYNVVSVSNADRSDYVSTLIFDYSGKENTVNFLAQRFNVLPDNVRQYRGTESQVDVRLVLGRDYAASSSQ